MLPRATRSAGGTGSSGTTMTELEEAVLEFERRYARPGRAKDAAIRATFDLSPSAYYVRLSRLIESPESIAYDPLLVQRLQRRVAERARWQRETDR